MNLEYVILYGKEDFANEIKLGLWNRRLSWIIQVGPKYNNHKGLLRGKQEDFPGGTVVKNPPANAGHMGSSPGSGRSHMPRSN